MFLFFLKSKFFYKETNFWSMKLCINKFLFLTFKLAAVKNVQHLLKFYSAYFLYVLKFLLEISIILQLVPHVF